MFKESTVEREIRGILRSATEQSLSVEELAFLGGALFALSWLLGRRRSSPSRYLVWLKEQSARGHFDYKKILVDMTKVEVEAKEETA